MTKLYYVKPIDRWIVTFGNEILTNDFITAFPKVFAKNNHIDQDKLIVIDGDFEYIGDDKSELVNTPLKERMKMAEHLIDKYKSDLV
ncbi:MAG: hypothetical protein ABF786_09390 [Oenococcus oeni]